MNQHQAPCYSAQSAIATTNSEVVAAFWADNATAIAHHYTRQSKLRLSQVDLITGRLAIQAFWQGVLDRKIYCAERATVEWQSTAPFGNEIGTYILRCRAGHLVDQGTYVALWQWRASRWQIRYEVWRSSWFVAQPGVGASAGG